MARDTRRSTATANAVADAVAALLNGGYLRIYSGARPVGADAAVTTQTLLAELRFATPAFAPATGGVASAHPGTGEDSAPASGTATWYRTLTADGATAVFDGTVGDSADYNLTLLTTSIVATQPIDLTGFSFSGWADA